MVGCQGQTVLMGEDPKWDEVGGMGETLHHTTLFKPTKFFYGIFLLIFSDLCCLWITETEKIKAMMRVQRTVICRINRLVAGSFFPEEKDSGVDLTEEAIPG